MRPLKFKIYWPALVVAGLGTAWVEINVGVGVGVGLGNCDGAMTGFVVGVDVVGVDVVDVHVVDVNVVDVNVVDGVPGATCVCQSKSRR